MASEKPDLEAALHSVVDDTADEGEASAESAEHLDGVRIQQLTKLRRAMIRSRSWCLIGMIAGFVAAGELVYRAVRDVRGWGAVAFLLFAVGSGVMGIFFLRRCVELHREIRMPMLGEPVTPPDFSTLGDGSQRWKNLEEMR